MRNEVGTSVVKRSASSHPDTRDAEHCLSSLKASGYAVCADCGRKTRVLKPWRGVP